MIVDPSTFPLRNWLKCIDTLLDLGFTEPEIDLALSQENYTLETLTERREIPCRNGVGTLAQPRESCKTPCVIINNRITVEVESVSFGVTSTKNVPGVLLRLPDQYQGLKHGALLHRLLLNRLPFFDLFRWKCYEIRGYKNHEEEIYMVTSHKGVGNSSVSLYVPVKALLAGDVEAIKERNVSYWAWYRTGSSYSLNHKPCETEEAFFERKKAEAALEAAVISSPEALKLFSFLEKMQQGETTLRNLSTSPETFDPPKAVPVEAQLRISFRTMSGATIQATTDQRIRIADLGYKVDLYDTWAMFYVPLDEESRFRAESLAKSVTGILTTFVCDSCHEKLHIKHRHLATDCCKTCNLLKGE